MKRKVSAIKFEKSRFTLISVDTSNSWAAAIAARLPKPLEVWHTDSLPVAEDHLSQATRCCLLLGDEIGPAEQLAALILSERWKQRSIICITNRRADPDLAWYLMEIGCHGVIRTWDDILRWIPTMRKFLLQATRETNIQHDFTKYR